MNIANCYKSCDTSPGCPFVTDAGLKLLAPFKHLTALDLEHTEVTDAGLKELAGHKNLAKLNLCGTKVTNGGLKDLAGCTNLSAAEFGEDTRDGRGVRALGRPQETHLARPARFEHHGCRV